MSKHKQCVCTRCVHHQTSETDAEMSSVAGRQLPSQTQLFAWSCKQFLLPVMQLPADQDPVSEEYHRRQRRYLHNSHLRTSARIQQHRAGKDVVVVLNSVVLSW